MTSRAPLEAFDPAKLQAGLLMAVENVHERLRVAREKHRVMVGNPVTETPAENIDMAGVTVLGYDECRTVLTDCERFSSSVYEHIMGPVMGRTLLEQEGAEHRASRALVSPLFRRSCWSGPASGPDGAGAGDQRCRVPLTGGVGGRVHARVVLNRSAFVLVLRGICADDTALGRGAGRHHPRSD